MTLVAPGQRRWLRSPRFLAILMLGLATLAVNCGGDDSTPPPTEDADTQDASTENVTMNQPKSEGPYTLEDWWPDRLDLSPLRRHAASSDPMGDSFNYAAEFQKLDLAALKDDIASTLTTSQDWWPADYGTYGGLMIRLAWHSAGTYRQTDGRGGSAEGTIRLAPLNSWPDNANLDKARRLLWPIKKKYGRSLSWADLMVLAGNVAFESMGFKTFGFGGGREDVYEADRTDWGPETEWLGARRFHGERDLKRPLGASQMGLIYVNPEGPDGVPDPVKAAHDIRVTFGRMGMNDEETVALIAGGHTLGKTHGAADPNKHVGPEPEGAPMEQQGLGWKNTHGKGNAEDTITSGLEGAWTRTPMAWSHDYFKLLFEQEWELTKSPAGAQQWTAKGDDVAMAPDAHVQGKQVKTMMLTTDLSLKEDPIYEPISRRFYEEPETFEDAFARAWYKLTHRDMGPHVRLLGPEVPDAQPWQDPVPEVDHPLVGSGDLASLKQQILDSELTTAQLVRTAWASASTYRDTDKRGGANGARIRLEPQKDWAVNQPDELSNVLETLEGIQTQFNEAQSGGKRISLADLIVYAGGVAIEEAASAAGISVTVPFRPGRTDATQAMTDTESFSYLEPKADGFRNYMAESDSERSAAEMLVDKADLLTLSAAEMTVLVGGMRVLGANADGSDHGVLTDRPGQLTNDFFVNLMGLTETWEASDDGTYSVTVEGKTWTGTSVDLLFGSNSELRALSEVYAADDAQGLFVQQFVAAWAKVMSLDRFDLRQA